MREEIRIKLWKICKNTPVESPLVIRPDSEPNFFELKNYFNNIYSKYYLELGSGWGEVVLELAKDNPDTGFLAMERKWNRLAQTDQLAREMGIENLIFSGVNFQWFMNEIFQDEIFDTILMNFPDPWPKRKHHKNRAINQTFLESIYRILKPNGKFLFATDHSGYFRHTIRNLRKFQKLKWKNYEWSNTRPNFPISEFEAEKKGEGKTIYYLERYKD